MIFLGMNGGIYLLVLAAAIADGWFLHTGAIKAAERLVDTKLLMTLVGATAVQLGAAYVVIVRYLFPDKKNGSPPE